MSAAIKAKSAKARANIAARMLLRTIPHYMPGGKLMGRAWDDCFEMGDGDEVFRLLIDKVMIDPELRREVVRHEYEMPPVLLEAARHPLRSSLEKGESNAVSDTPDHPISGGGLV